MAKLEEKNKVKSFCFNIPNILTLKVFYFTHSLQLKHSKSLMPTSTVWQPKLSTLETSWKMSTLPGHEQLKPRSC